jgi:hypothetical protein
MRALEDLKSPAAELEHLRHERQSFQPSFHVERREDLLFAPHLDPLPGY